MNNVKSQVVRNAKNDADLDDTNYDGSQYVFSWNRDTPMLRADVYKCPNCNHSLSVDSSGRCKDRDCTRCGYSVKLYGYRDLTYDTQDGQDEEQYDVYDDSEDSEIDSRHVTFASKDQILNTATRDAGVASKDGKAQQVEKVEPTAESETIEHLDSGASDVSVVGICSYLCGCICILLIALCIAKSRGELSHGKGGMNLSLIVCIIFFPYTYLTYAFVDWLTSPNHGC
jgi:hypothetical protein